MLPFSRSTIVLAAAVLALPIAAAVSINWRPCWGPTPCPCCNWTAAATGSWRLPDAAMPFVWQGLQTRPVL